MEFAIDQNASGERGIVHNESFKSHAGELVFQIGQLKAVRPWSAIMLVSWLR
jgi:hypothetical protein